MTGFTKIMHKVPSRTSRQEWNTKESNRVAKGTYGKIWKNLSTWEKRVVNRKLEDISN